VAFGAGSDDVLRVHQGSWVLGASDDMLTVTIGAHRGFLDTFCPCSSVDALLPLSVNLLVTLPAGFGQMGAGSFCVRVSSGANAMNAVTISANSGRLSRRCLLAFDTFPQQLTMHASLVVEQSFALRDLMPPSMEGVGELGALVTKRALLAKGKAARK